MCATITANAEKTNKLHFTHFRIITSSQPRYLKHTAATAGLINYREVSRDVPFPHPAPPNPASPGLVVAESQKDPIRASKRATCHLPPSCSLKVYD